MIIKIAAIHFYNFQQDSIFSGVYRQAATI